MDAKKLAAILFLFVRRLLDPGRSLSMLRRAALNPCMFLLMLKTRPPESLHVPFDA